MTYIRILEFANLRERPEGAWHTREQGGGAVLVQRGDAPLPPADDEARHAVTVWNGVRLWQCGSDRRGSMVFILKYPVPCEFHDEFDAWLRHEHMPMLLEEPTWYGCQFFRALGGSRHSFAAVHELEPQALTSDARNRSVDTPWWHRLKRHDWFDKAFTRARLIAVAKRP